MAGRSAGPHTISVRATDNTGATQTEQWADPVPDGATGWHSVDFSVMTMASSAKRESSSRNFEKKPAGLLFC